MVYGPHILWTCEKEKEETHADRAAAMGNQHDGFRSLLSFNSVHINNKLRFAYNLRLDVSVCNT